MSVPQRSCAFTLRHPEIRRTPRQIKTHKRHVSTCTVAATAFRVCVPQRSCAFLGPPTAPIAPRRPVILTGAQPHCLRRALQCNVWHTNRSRTLEPNAGERTPSETPAQRPFTPHRPRLLETAPAETNAPQAKANTPRTTKRTHPFTPRVDQHPRPRPQTTLPGEPFRGGHRRPGCRRRCDPCRSNWWSPGVVGIAGEAPWSIALSGARGRSSGECLTSKSVCLYSMR